MKIAMIGQKGIPSVYGGVETHVEHLSAALAARGHEVTVYCRPHYTLYRAQTYRRVRLRKKWSLPSKHFDTITHTFNSSLDALFRRFDVVHYHGIGPGSLSWITRLLGRPTVVTVHALDWRWRKWNWPARRYLKFAEWVSVRVPDRTIAISRAVADHIARRYGRSVAQIPNGVAAPDFFEPQLIRERYGLEKHGYLLCVGRLISDRGFHLAIEALRTLPAGRPLVIVGGSSHEESYEHRLRAMLDPARVILTGFQGGRVLAELYSNALAFVHPSLMEGMSMALLEALSCGLPAVVSDIPENLEVVRPPGVEPIAFAFRSGDTADLRRVVQQIIADSQRAREVGQRATRYVTEHYSWPRVAELTEAVYLEAQRRHGGRQP